MISVTSVCLDTGTWGLTDVRVRTGLADGGWADVFVCEWSVGGGWRGGGGDGAQSVTSVCLEPGA